MDRNRQKFTEPDINGHKQEKKIILGLFATPWNKAHLGEYP